ncbi:MAG: two-component system sensor histidine kinase NtrB [Candidatus Binatia bacterium]
MEQIPDVINPRGIEPEANEADAERRLKLVYCKGHQDQSLYSKFVENKARRDRLVQIGNLAAVFAHEVANPLSGLSASLQFALKDLARFTRRNSVTKDLDISIIQETLQGALREVDRLVELLDEVRLAVPPQTLNLKLTDLRKIIEGILALEGTGYRSAGITVHLDLQDNLPAIEIDGSKMKQAILNLCKNAVEAMTDGGCLTIKAYRAEGNVVLEIRDDGFGVPDDVDVFELFKTTKPGGTGLGLPVVEQVISAHHGTIDYRSDGCGTTFTVRLPLPIQM